LAEIIGGTTAKLSAPFKEVRQFYFGSLPRDSNTFPREWPHVHYEPASPAEITPQTSWADI